MTHNKLKTPSFFKT